MITKTAQNFLSRAHDFMKQPVRIPNLVAKAERADLASKLQDISEQMAERKQGYSAFKDTLEYPVKPAGILLNQSKGLRERLVAQQKELAKAEQAVEPRSYARQMHNIRQRLGKMDRFDKAFEDRRMYEALKNRSARIEGEIPEVDQRIREGKSLGSRYAWSGALGGTGLGLYGLKRLADSRNPKNG